MQLWVRGDEYTVFTDKKCMSELLTYLFLHTSESQTRNIANIKIKYNFFDRLYVLYPDLNHAQRHPPKYS